MQLRSSWFDPMRSLSWLRTNVTLTSCMLLSMLLSVLLSVPPEAPLGALLVMLLGVLLGVLLVMLLQLLQRGKRTSGTTVASAAATATADTGKAVTTYGGSSIEGMNARKGIYFTPRADTVANVLALAEHHGAILINAPPQSGKTSLLQLIEDAASSMPGRFQTVTFVSLLEPQNRNNQGFCNTLHRISKALADVFCSRSPPTAEDCVSAPPPGLGRCHLVLVDEAQMLYSRPDHPLWAGVKYAQQGGVNVQIVLAGLFTGRDGAAAARSPSCGSVTFTSASQVTLDPAQYKTKGNPSLCTPSLALTWREYEQLLAGYDAYMSYLNARLTDEELIKFLFEVTAGQVGLIVRILDEIWERVRQAINLDNAQLNQVARHLLRSEGVYDALGDVRSVLAFPQFVDYEDVFEAILCAQVLTREQAELADRLTHRGFLMGDNMRYSFVSPLHQQYYLVQLYRGRFKVPQDCSKDFDAFLLNTMRRLSTYALANSLSRSSDVYERRLQMEWYRAAVSYLPLGALVVPDVGPVFGAKGYVHFWVTLPGSNLAWAIELLWEGVGGLEHGDRFEPGGRYANMPMTKFAIIDFRQHSNPRVKRPNFWHIKLRDDFSGASIMTATGKRNVKFAS